MRLLDPLRERARLNRPDDGSLLIDVLIGIAITSLVALIAVSATGSYREKAYTTTMTSDLKNASTAMETSKIETGEYPDAIPESFRSSRDNTVVLGSGGSAGWDSVDTATACNGVTVNGVRVKKNSHQGNLSRQVVGLGATLSVQPGSPDRSSSVQFIAIYRVDDGPITTKRGVKSGASITSTPAEVGMTGDMYIGLGEIPTNTSFKLLGVHIQVGSNQALTTSELGVSDPQRCRFYFGDQISDLGDQPAGTPAHAVVPFGSLSGVVPAPAPTPTADSSAYCLESIHDKTPVKLSWLSDGGLKDGGCA